MHSHVIQRFARCMAIVRTKPRQLQMAPLFQLRLVPRRHCSTSVTKEIFVQDQIHFGLKKQALEFKLTTRGHDIDIASTRIWKIGDKDTVAPYFGQDRALLTLLKTLWNNCSPEIDKKYSNAPRCAVLRRELGWGKSRFLSEWILQVFKNQRMLKLFMEGNESSTKKSFLNAIYRSAYRQYTVLINGSTIKSPINAQTIPDIIKREILERFAGMEIELKGKKLRVTDKEIEGLDPTADHNLLPTLFIQLCNARYPAPQKLPYNSSAVKHDFNYITFLIDDCHNIGSTEQKTDSDPISALWQMFAQYEGFIKLSNVVPTIVFSGENSIKVPNGANSILLDSLLDRKVLWQISQTFFKMQWFVSFSDAIVEKDLPSLNWRIGNIFQQHFFLTFGVPTALKNLMENSIEPMNRALNRIDEASLKDLDAKLKKIHRRHTNHSKLVLPNDVQELLNIKAALCLPCDTSNVKVDELIASGQLIEHQFASGESKLALPIHNFSYKELTEPLHLLKSTIDPASSISKSAREVSLASLVLCPSFRKGCSDKFSDKLEPFGMGVASAIYAKYHLKRLEHPDGKVLLTDVMAHDFASQPLFQEAHIVSLKGIIASSWYDFAEPVICVERSWQSEVVRFPVKIKNEDYCVVIYCWAEERQPSIVSLLKRLYDVQRKRGVKCLFIGTAPKIQDSKMLSQDESQVLHNAALVPVQKIVSPLYLHNLQFTPRRYDFSCFW